MAYLAIARKWRPQRFEDIVGQGHVTRTLQNAIRLDRVHHAFLFTGARGVGKTTAARILAKALNCEHGPTPTPCNECRCCKEITAGIASDVQEIDAASNTGVDNVRDLRDKLRYLPSSGRRRIYIVDEVHMLSIAAFNALLKTLEEPPPHVVFIFATTDPQKVPDTILSRCQRFDFKRIPLKALAEKLAEIAAKEEIRISESALLMIAREAEGSMRDAESLLDQVLSSSESEVTDQNVVEVLGLFDRRLLFECLRGILERSPERSLAVIERVYGFGFDIKPFTRDLLELVRHLNVIKVSGNASRFIDVSAEEFQALGELAAKTSLEELSRQFEILLKGFDEIARSEAPRLALEMALLRMTQVRPVLPVDTLVTRLNAMESVLKGAGVSRAVEVLRTTAPRGPEPSRSSDALPSALEQSEALLSPRGESHAAPVDFESPARTGKGGAASAAVFLDEPSGGARQSAEIEKEPAQSRETGFQAHFGLGRGPLNAGETPSVDVEDSSSDDLGADWSSEVVEETTHAPSSVGQKKPDGTPQKSWLDFMRYWVGEADVELKPIFLKDAAPLKEEVGRIVVGFRKDLVARQARREASSPAVQSLLQRFFGQPIQLECVLISDGDAPGASFVAWEDGRKRAHHDALLQREKSSPPVQAALKIFGVREEDVRVEVERADS